MFHRGVILLSFITALIETLLLIQRLQFITRCISSGLPQLHQLDRYYSLKMIIPVSWNNEEMKSVQRNIFTKFHFHNTFHYIFISNILNHWTVMGQPCYFLCFPVITREFLPLFSLFSRACYCVTHKPESSFDRNKSSIYIKECFRKCPLHLTSPHLTGLCGPDAVLHSCSLSRWWKTVLRRIQSLLLWWCVDGWWIEGALPHNRHSQHRVSLHSDICVCHQIEAWKVIWIKTNVCDVNHVDMFSITAGWVCFLIRNHLFIIVKRKWYES